MTLLLVRIVRLCWISRVVRWFPWKVRKIVGIVFLLKLVTMIRFRSLLRCGVTFIVVRVVRGFTFLRSFFVVLRISFMRLVCSMFVLRFLMVGV